MKKSWYFVILFNTGNTSLITSSGLSYSSTRKIHSRVLIEDSSKIKKFKGIYNADNSIIIKVNLSIYHDSQPFSRRNPSETSRKTKNWPKILPLGFENGRLSWIEFEISCWQYLKINLIWTTQIGLVLIIGYTFPCTLLQLLQPS